VLRKTSQQDVARLVRGHELNITTFHYSVKVNAVIVLICAFNRHSAKGDGPMVRTMGRWQVQDRLSVVTALDSDSSSEESSPREGGHDVRRETDTQAAQDAPSPAATPQEQAQSTCHKPPSTAQILREIASSDRQVCLHAQPPFASAIRFQVCLDASFPRTLDPLRFLPRSWTVLCGRRWLLAVCTRGVMHAVSQWTLSWRTVVARRRGCTRRATAFWWEGPPPLLSLLNNG
jgi:hypothetical protein